MLEIAVKYHIFNKCINILMDSITANLKLNTMPLDQLKPNDRISEIHLSHEMEPNNYLYAILYDVVIKQIESDRIYFTYKSVFYTHAIGTERYRKMEKNIQLNEQLNVPYSDIIRICI